MMPYFERTYIPVPKHHFGVSMLNFQGGTG